jgi:dGTPase
MPKEIRDRVHLEAMEQGYFLPGAALSTDTRLASRQYPQGPDDFRTAFQRDYTRIIHSRAFRRMRHKTQVFISPRNDHLCTRLEHSLHVASVATTIAQAMGLNEHLVQAIAVGHDLGHAPFGHKGEQVLQGIASSVELEFCHELQSLRVVDRLDSPYKDHVGLNLTFAVRDGIACHYGEGFERELRPDREKEPESLATMGKKDRGVARPATLEGCVVRWSDKIAYLGRDLEDALELKLISLGDVPEVVQDRLGLTNGAIIGSLISDLLKNSNEDCLSVSEEVHESLNALYKFNMERIYKSKQATSSFSQVSLAMTAMYEYIRLVIVSAQEKGDVESLLDAKGIRGTWTMAVLREFLEKDVRDWRTQKSEQLAIDYVAGMTDSFFVSAFTELFFPKGV